MIVTHRKDPSIVRELAAPFKKIIIVGCSECAAVCRTGGSEQVKEMAEFLSEHEILATISIESPCDKRISSRDMKRLDEELSDCDALVALCCGSGVQALAEVTGKRIVTALDTDFLGMVERLGVFYERCRHCGECLLNDTAEICPVTRCPKGIRNGPCEGIEGTKCEVDKDRDCVWHTIYENLKSLGRTDLFLKYHEPVDWSVCNSPRETAGERKTP